jgi:glutamyl-tRNA reductase
MAAAAGSSSSAATTLRSSLKFSSSHPHPPSQFPNSTFTPHRLSLNPLKCTLRSQNPIPQNAIVSKPSPLELLKTSSADSKNSFNSIQFLYLYYVLYEC